jgi:integrase
MSSMKWKKTKVQFLLRDENSGGYYARLYANGKQLWRSLKTDVFSVAQARLAVQIKEIRSGPKQSQTVETGKATTVETMARTYLERERKSVSNKESSIHYREQIVAAILKSWPELKTTKPKDVTESDCESWASRYAEKYSPTRYNNSVDSMRAIFGVAIKQGLIFRNPAATLGKLRPNQKRLELPTREQFDQIVKSVREQGAWCSQQCGDLIEFLAYSGTRVNEAKYVRWSDVQDGAIWISGGVTGTKNSERRQVPIIEPMASLIQDLRDNPRYVRSDDRAQYVLAVCECQKALSKACAAIGAKRLTHHDLRHLFATRCIESGVDIPTVSRWLGHKDGGALAMRTYGHLRSEHSQAMAQLVKF